MARVLSSDEARGAVTRMQAIIDGGLVDEIRNLDAQGQRLSDPSVWDGRLAAEFRGVWPQTKAALDRTVTELGELRARIDVINRDIMTAGGNA